MLPRTKAKLAFFVGAASSASHPLEGTDVPIKPASSFGDAQASGKPGSSVLRIFIRSEGAQGRERGVSIPPSGVGATFDSGGEEGQSGFPE